MIPLGIFGVYMRPLLFLYRGDAAATTSNIMASQSLFQMSILSALLTQLDFLLLVLVFYKLFKPVNKNLALVMVVLVLVAVPIAMLNKLNLFAVLLLVNSSDYLTSFSPDQIQSQVKFFLDLHEAVF
jgi:Domain of unknown function (DUF4386)